MSELSILSGDVDEYHWTPPSKFDQMDMQDALNMLGTFEDCYQYYIGDGLLFAKEHYGELFSQLIPEDKVETWRQYLWVCEKVEPQIRRGLSCYSQAKLIAKLSYDDQVDIVKSGARDMTCRDLEQRVKARTKSNNPKDEALPHVILTTGRKHYVLSLDGKQLLLHQIESVDSKIPRRKPDCKAELKKHYPTQINIATMKVTEQE